MVYHKENLTELIVWYQFFFLFWLGKRGFDCSSSCLAAHIISQIFILSRDTYAWILRRENLCFSVHMAWIFLC